MRRLEEAIIRTLRGYGIESGRVAGRTGVWLDPDGWRPERKIAAIGVRVSKRTTLHGFALNVAPNLLGFGNIIPCGISDAGVTSMAAELPGPAPSLVEVARAMEPHLSDMLSWETYEQTNFGA